MLVSAVLCWVRGPGERLLQLQSFLICPNHPTTTSSAQAPMCGVICFPGQVSLDMGLGHVLLGPTQPPMSQVVPQAAPPPWQSCPQQSRARLPSPPVLSRCPPPAPARSPCQGLERGGMYLQERMPWSLPVTPFGLELKSELPNGGVPQNKELGGGPTLRERESDEAARTGRGCALGRPFGHVVSSSSGRGVWKKRLRVKGDVRRGGVIWSKVPGLVL